MRACVRFALPDGSTRLLGPGDIVGRLVSAALHIDDARISEAHALVSLRGRELKLLALRGMFAVAGRPVRDVVLEPGLIVQPARGLELRVLDVTLPDHVLALQAPGLPRTLLAGTTSVVAEPRMSLVPRYQGDAAAHVWNTGDGWRLRPAGGDVRPLEPGDSFEVAGIRIEAVAVPLDLAGHHATRAEGGVQQPLRIIASYDTVQLRRGDALALALNGISARIVSELVAFDGPVAWHVLAGEIWAGSGDRAQLRRKWDVNLARLRKKLREAGLRDDLVKAGGGGHVELLMYEGDTVDDRT